MEKENFLLGGKVFLTLNILSVILSSCIVVLIGCIFLWSKEMRKRSSLQFQAVIGMIDASRHLQLLLANNMTGTFACKLLGFYTAFGAHLYMFLSGAIAFHLHYTYLQKKDMGDRTRWLVWAVPISLVMVIDLLPFTKNAYGLTYNKGCNIHQDFEYERELYFLLYGIMQTPTILYCLYVVVAIFSKPLELPSSDYMMDTMLNQNRLGDLAKQVQRNVRLIAMYPLIAVLCLSGQVINSYNLIIAGVLFDWLQPVLYTGLSITGLLNFLVLICDRTIHNLFWRKPSLEASASAEPAIKRKSRFNSIYDTALFSATTSVVVAKTPETREVTPLLQFQRVLENCKKI